MEKIDIDREKLNRIVESATMMAVNKIFEGRTGNEFELRLTELLSNTTSDESGVCVIFDGSGSVVSDFQGKLYPILDDIANTVTDVTGGGTDVAIYVANQGLQEVGYYQAREITERSAEIGENINTLSGKGGADIEGAVSWLVSKPLADEREGNVAIIVTDDDIRFCKVSEYIQGYGDRILFVISDSNPEAYPNDGTYGLGTDNVVFI